MWAESREVVYMTEAGVGLSGALEALRSELQEAWSASQGQRVRFRASEVTITLETALRLDKEASGGVRWYVVQAGGGVRSGTESTQTVVLSLVPHFYDENGNPAPLDVADVQLGPD
jgi:hypothetical protein